MARSDYLFAAAVRQNALQTDELYGHLKEKLWFEGHWGFQYYMTELGGHALDMQQSDHHPGDYLALPLNNSNVHFPDVRGEQLYSYGPGFLTVMNMFIGAGFYSSAHGPLPFVFGQVPPDSVVVYH